MSNGVKLTAHERITSVRLAKLGYDHELIPRNPNRRTADAWMLGGEWDWEAPIGMGDQAITRLIEKGIDQSARQVVDLHRYPRSALVADAQILTAFRRYPDLQEVLALPADQGHYLIRRRP